ncbi:MAG: hypothetical protein JW832_04490, partial [Deltaproteobacteria bacterium]|nr:hypothetical protein [Deltaproteobacteria bacterium]
MNYVAKIYLPLEKLLQALSEMAPERTACLLSCIAAFIVWADIAPAEAKTEAVPKPASPALRSTVPASV